MRFAEEIDTYIVPSKFKTFAGTVGALELARLACDDAERTSKYDIKTDRNFAPKYQSK